MPSIVSPSSARTLRRAGLLLPFLWLLALPVQAQDADGDGLSDFTESQIGSNPSLADTDGDGDDDWLEYYRCRSPLPAAPGASCVGPTPPGAMPRVPLPVIVPPDRPVPATTLVTVPPLSLSMPSAKPAGTPVRPDQGAALATAARSASGVARTSWRGARMV